MATLLEMLRLLKGLLGDGKAFVGPLHVNVDVTRRCNLRCVGCRYHSPEVYLPSPGDQTILDISIELLEKLCDELRTMGTREFILIGEGEPLLHPHIFEIISMAKRAGFRTSLISNGTLLDQTRIQLLIDSKLDILRVSLWANSPEGYVEQYPGTDPVYFERALEGLKTLKLFKKKNQSKVPYVILHQPLNRYNFQKIDSRIDLALEIGCEGIAFSPFYSQRGNLFSLSLSPEEERSLYLHLARLKKRIKPLPLNHTIDQTLLRYRIGREIGGKYPCYIGWFHTRIKIDGSVVPCNPCNIIIGNLKETPFHEIWNNSAYRNFRRQTMFIESFNFLRPLCDCEFCCYLENNVKIHRFFKWFLPYVRYQNREAVCPKS
jgi:MoaA/NifB/PqqE/SkfB family radical SAM enzyme